MRDRGYSDLNTISKKSYAECIQYLELPAYHEISRTRKYAAIGLIAIVQFSMAIERSGIDAVIVKLQAFFGVNDTTIALLQTFSSVVAVLTHLAMSMFGDRFDRKFLILTATTFWLVLELMSLMVTPSMFIIYLVLRAVSIIGLSVVSNLSQVVTADLFDDAERGRVLMATSLSTLLAILLPTIGTSFILSSDLSWKIVLLVPPVLAIPSLILLSFVMPSAALNGQFPAAHSSPLKVFSEFWNLLKIKSISLLIVGHALADVYGKAAVFWLPTIKFYGYSWMGADFFYGLSYPVFVSIATVISTVGVFTGMSMNLWIAESWRYGLNMFSGGRNPRALPIVASYSFLLTKPLLVVTMTLFTINFPLFLVAYFIQAHLGGGNIALVSHTILNVTPSRKRAAVIGLQYLIAGILESPSGLLVGTLSDLFRGDAVSNEARFTALLKAIYVLLVFVAAGTILMGAMCYYYPCDVACADAARKESAALLGGRNLLANYDEYDDDDDEIPRTRGTSILEIVRRNTMEVT